MFAEIINWVEQKPNFWQIAIEKLIRNNLLTAADHDEIKNVCKVENGLPGTPYMPVDLPALRAHIASVISDQNIVLTKIHGIQNINALSSDASLEFSPNGLTIIYGDNGSGKSSYTSILKHICNTRGHKTTINRNLYNTSPSFLDQKALIDYSEGGLPPVTISLLDTLRNNGTLKKINVFDSHSAQHYIEGEDEIAFIPQGLSLIEKFASCLKTIESEIESERVALDLMKFDFSLMDLENDTETKNFINSINHSTKRSELWNNCKWDPSKEQIIYRIDAAIAELKSTDPQKKLETNHAKIGRITILKKKLETLEENLIYREAIENINDVLKGYDIAVETLQASSKAAFAGLPVPNIGGESWKQLWESARRFYNENMGSAVFPEIQAESNCPLCLQELNSEAKQRFQSFEEFIIHDSQRTFDNAAGAYDTKIKLLKNLNFDLTNFEATMIELEEYDPDFRKKNTTYMDQLIKVQKIHLQNLDSKKSSEALPIEAIEVNQTELINSIIKIIELENQELSTLSISEELVPLEKELRELKNKKKTYKNYSRIGREIYRLKKSNLLAQCKIRCNTRTCTNISNQLTATYVTQSLQEKFQYELTRLGFKNIHLLAETRGERGKQYHYLKLNESNAGNLPLKEILSEGEHRCIALATFLSELTLSEHSSAIIFDDPVSSLDHKWRNKISKRIVEESEIRQVIVFTHDISFLLMIQEQCESLEKALTVRSLTRKIQETGIVASNPPWDALSVKARIGILKTDQVNLAQIEKNKTEEDYKAAVQPLYGKLRETWERAVEEVVLHEVVKRFAREVQTKRLEKVIDLTQEDYNFVDNNMSKCSIYFYGHDNSGTLNEQFPDAAEFLEDIIILESFVKGIRKRRT